MTTVCKFNLKQDEINKEMSSGKWRDIVKFSEVWRIAEDYDRMKSANTFVQRAFDRPLMKKFLSKNKDYDWILVMLSNKTEASNNHEYVEKMQIALRSRIAEAWWTWKLSVWNNKEIYVQWREVLWLSSTDIQFIEDLYWALEDFSAAWDDAWNPNLAAVIQDAINNVIVNQSLWDKRTPKEWYSLWQLIALASPTQWKNNIFWLLWILDASKHETTVYYSDWTKEKVLISDLYSPDDKRMQNTVSLLFDKDTDDPAPWIIYNPTVYRNSIKTMMKATEVDDFNRWLKSILKFSAMWKLSTYTAWLVVWRLSWWMMWLTCFYTWYLNMMSYKKKLSNQTLHHALKQIWLWQDYFSFNEDPEKWVTDRLSYFWDSLMAKDPRKWNVNDPTRKQDFISRFTRNHLSQFSWMLMWVANIFWDTVFRWEYQLIAMDMALQNLWWDDWNLESHLLTTSTVVTDKDWTTVTTIEPNEDAFYTLLQTYIKKIWDVTWFPQVEWWWQSPLFFDLTWTHWLNRAWRASMNAALNMMHWMTQWWTTYVNNTYRILAGWTVNAIYDFNEAFLWWEKKKDLFNKAYDWPGWNWLIRKYTRQVDVNWTALPWESAQELVSKEEYAREVCRLLAGIRNMYRLWNMACRDQETWEFSLSCAFKNFASVAYLPWQAAQIAHPIIRATYNTITEAYKNYSYFTQRPELEVKNTAILTESLTTNILKPMFRSLYPIKEIALAIDKWYSDYNEDDFMDRLIEVAMDSTDAMLYYTSDELASYVYSAWAYWPKSYLNNDMTVFWTPSELRDTMWKINKIKSVERVSRDWLWARLNDLFPTIRLFSNAGDILNWKYDTTEFYAWEVTDKFLHDYNSDEWIRALEKWTFTPEMLSNYDYMQYVWENLTSDWQSYWADFKNWVRDNKYNNSEIQYFEVLLQKDLMDARKYNNQASDLQIYDAALQKFFAWTPTYQNIKDAIQAYADAWEAGMWAYVDYLASAHWLQETTWVKWIALVAEYMKRVLMEQEWLQYSSSNDKAQQAAIKQIENQVAWILWPSLWLADRRQYSNLMWRWFVEKHPEYKNYDPFQWLTDKDWEWNIHGDVKTTWTLWTALWANNLARSELITWDTNWYELANVFTEKFWSPFDENWNFDNVKAAQIIDMVTLLDQALEDADKTPMERSLILTPTLTKNLDLWTWALSSESDTAQKFRDQVWEAVIDNIRWLLYDTYNDLTSVPELLDLLNNEDVIKKILGKSWWSLYYWKNTKKNYDYYRKPADVFKAWWSKNLSKFVNGYGNWKSKYAWNYSSREFYFLNQRANHNSIQSARIAPDIPLTIWGFSKTTVKSKNPVSWFTTNIKPWEERPTAKFGKGKGIVWWEGSRWPVTNFHVEGHTR